MAEIMGGDALARMLAAEGVNTVFGIIDGTYFGFYSSLKKHGIRLITPRHETSAAHMAGAYARATGKLGVCMASNGPGVANVLSGIVVEQAEGNRVLLVTSARRVGVMYPERFGGFQCFDQTGVIGKTSKWSERVPSPARLPELARAALRACFEGRPGVVHLDIPEDIMNGKAEYPDAWAPAKYRRLEPLYPSPEAVERAADALIKAELPMIHAGSGVIHSGAYSELKAVAELLQAPVTTSWAGRAAMAETSELVIPLIHLELVEKIRNEADTFLILGSRLGETDRWAKAPFWRPASESTTIQVDLADDAIGVNRPADVAVQADVKVFLTLLLARLQARFGELKLEERTRTIARYARLRREARAELDERLKDMSAPMNSAHAAAACRELFPDGSIMVVDGGNSAIWANFYHEIRTPGTVLSTFKFGMLGAGTAQALGAAAASDKPVCCITGDGAMGFHPQEIETAVRNKMKIVYVVLCDKQWGMVKMNQQFMLKPIKTLIFKALGPDETINADLGEIRFDDLARSMGAHGERVADPKDLRAALKRCLETDGPSVLHVDVDPVKHMWAPGLKWFKDMHGEPKGK